jgi:cysteine desulfurase / selenocysteine lyase
MEFNVKKIREDFPILTTKVNGKPLVYFDNGATTQKPIQVIKRISKYYEDENSNVHRGVHTLSQLATEKFEGARNYVAQFINAPSSKEIIFTKGTTESVNLLATVFRSHVNAGDTVMISAMEHHSNLVPWQQLCKEKKAKIVVIPVLENGELDMEGLKKLINPKVKMLAITHISNVLGTENPIEEIVKIAHAANIPVFVDGAQAIAHTVVDVQKLDCDFYAFSAHKAYGPMGTGVLFGKSEWLEKLPPYQFGGEMIESVQFDKVVYNSIPYKFEAGTPNVAGVVGMEEALRYISGLSIKKIRQYEDELIEYATAKINEIEGVRIIGRAKEKTAVLSFVVDGVHPYDLGTLLDQLGIAVRTGYHCAQPLIESFGLTGTLRVSLAMYNTIDEVDVFILALIKSINMLK